MLYSLVHYCWRRW